MEDTKNLVPENSKRIKISDNSFLENNSQELSTISNSSSSMQSADGSTSSDKLQTNDDIITSVVLPMELILKIISHISDRKDLINCFSLSKGIYKMMFKTKDIMRKILYELTCKDNDKLLKTRGKFIRSLTYKCFKDDRIYFLPSLKYTPNVENLSLVDIGKSRFYYFNGGTATDFESGSDDGSIIDETDYESYDEYAKVRVNYSINLPKLQSLSISNQLRESINCFKVENLTKLSITFDSRYQCFAIFVDFFCQLKNLKEFSLEGDLVFRFPKLVYQDIVKCKLRKIDISFERRIENNNFTRFLETQAAEIEEMDFNLKLDEEEFIVIFMKCLKLKRITLGNKRNYDFLSNEHPEWELSSLTFYEQAYGSRINLARLTKKFPNLKTFVGHNLLSVDLENFGQNLMDLKIKGIYKLTNGQFLTINLSSIDVKFLDLDELKNSTFPNLKELKAAAVVGFNEDIWKEFTAGLLSIEHIRLEKLEATNIELIFKHLKDIEALKIIELSFNNEKVIINLALKTVKYSWSKSCESSGYKDILDIFEGFEQLEY